MGKSKLFLKVSCFVLVISLCFLLGFFFYYDINKKEVRVLEKIEPTPVVPIVKESTLSLIMVGDSLIHSAVYGDAKEDTGYNFKNMLKEIKPIVQKYDLAYYNQETILGGEQLGLSSYPRFNSPYEVGDAFIDAGFNLVSLSTNHTLDKGEKAILNSRAYWDKQNEVLAAGSYSSFEDKEKNDIRVRNDISYTMLSYTDLTNGLKVPTGKGYLLNIYNENQVKIDIEKVRDKVDILIVSMHWGDEYQHSPNARQKKIANYLASLGVDLIIGTHSHVIQPIEFINNTMVVYSLGNVLSAQRTTAQLTGGMASVTFRKAEKDKEKTITIENPTTRLIYTYSKGASTTGRYDFVLYPYRSLNNSLLSNYQSHYDNYSKIFNGSSQKVKSIDFND